MLMALMGVTHPYRQQSFIHSFRQEAALTSGCEEILCVDF